MATECLRAAWAEWICNQRVLELARSGHAVAGELHPPNNRAAGPPRRPIPGNPAQAGFFLSAPTHSLASDAQASPRDGGRIRTAPILVQRRSSD